MAAKLVIAVTLAMAAAGCRGKPSDTVASLTDEFVHTTLSFSPSAATSAGLHQFRNQKLDDMLDDMSVAGLANQKRFYTDFQARLKALPADRLSADDRADV